MKNPLFRAAVVSFFLLILGLIFLIVAICTEPLTTVHKEISEEINKRHEIVDKDKINIINPNEINKEEMLDDNRILTEALIKII